jgi:hypothetical protein
MSLRSEIRAAIDEMAPSMGGLPERVVDTVLAELPRRQRRDRMLFRIRAPLSLIAAIVAIALVAAVLVGGRLIQDWNASHKPSPAGGDYQSVLAQLEARSLNLPNLKPGDTCPVTSPSGLFGFGTGPVYADGGPETTTAWGYYFDITWITAPGLTGPVLVRGRDLMSDRVTVFVGAYSAGSVVGTDTQAGGQVVQRSELAFDAAQPHSRVRGYGYFPVRQGMSNGWVGCIGFQIDGPTFTETFMAFAPP